MGTVGLRDDLRLSLEKETASQERSVEDLVNEAVQQYLEAMDIKKIREEQAAYERLYPDLKHTHPGKWVAVHEGRLVDCDEDDAALHQRLLAGYGDVAILLTRVEGEAIRELRIRTPRIDRPGR